MTYPNPDGLEKIFAPPPDMVVETHISKVFLCGDRAFKLKKAVKLPFLDFSTLALRLTAAQREVQFNRRSAAELYLGLRPVLKGTDGALRLGDSDDSSSDAAVEWLVEMRRFAADATLDRRLADGRIDGRDIDAVAEAVADLHVGATRSPRSAFCSAHSTATMNGECFSRLPAAALDVARLQALTAATLHEVSQHADHLRARGAEGHVRRGHGDLHLRNIAWVDGRPLLFDCLEFDDALAEIDTLYDLAFLVMDLLANARADLAARLLGRYLECLPDDGGLPLLPLYVSLRAAIRAHIAGLNPAEWQRAQLYVALAERALQPRPPRVLAVGGPSGSGKSRLARGLAACLPGVAGAIVVRSDVTRKNLFGVATRENLPQEAYSPEATRRTYAAMLARADKILAAGQSVVLDAVHGREGERAAAAAFARERGLRFDAIWLHAPEDHLISRVVARKGDASDATPDVVRRQLESIVPPADWQHLVTSQDREQTLARAMQMIAE